MDELDKVDRGCWLVDEIMNSWGQIKYWEQTPPVYLQLLIIQLLRKIIRDDICSYNYVVSRFTRYYSYRTDSKMLCRAKLVTDYYIGLFKDLPFTSKVGALETFNRNSNFGSPHSLLKKLAIATNNFNERDYEGITIFMALVILGIQPRVCDILINLGADPFAVDNNGDTILRYLHRTSRCYSFFQKLFREAGTTTLLSAKKGHRVYSLPSDIIQRVDGMLRFGGKSSPRGRKRRSLRKLPAYPL